MIVLTIDLGTSATKVALWDGPALLSLARSSLETTHPAPRWAEQDPSSWWSSVAAACTELRERDPDRYGRITAIGCSAARETFTLLDELATTHGPGILWSDQRAHEEAEALGDPAKFRARTGVQLTAGCCAAKVAWVRAHDRDAWCAGRWIVAPRDLVVARLTNQVVTDHTLASRTGLYALDGALTDDPLAERLPPVLPSMTVLDAAGIGTPALGLGADVRVVIGAGDRACEVIGVDAQLAPMVAWGTTANVSVPHPGPIGALPSVAQVSRGAVSGFLVEAGLSAAGAAIAWLARLTGQSHDDLVAGAAAVPPGADGVVALPWLAGAHAPWWQPDAHAAFLGLTDAHGPAELARAVIEGVAFDVARCLDLIAPDAEELALAGGGAADPLWRSIVSAATGLPVVRRAIDDAASVGARLLVASALSESLSLDEMSPVIAREEPDPGLLRAYSSLRETADAIASAVISSVH